MGTFDEALGAYIALKVALQQAGVLQVGETAEIDIPDITIAGRVKGQTVRVRITSVNVERVS